MGLILCPKIYITQDIIFRTRLYYNYTIIYIQNDRDIILYTASSSFLFYGEYNFKNIQNKVTIFSLSQSEI